MINENELTDFQKDLIKKQQDVARRMRNECEVKPEDPLWEQVRDLHDEYEKEKGNSKYKTELHTIRGMLSVNFVLGRSGYRILKRDEFESMTTLEILMNCFDFFIKQNKQ